MYLKEGTLLHNGTYRIVRFLSHGGFGCTYEAEHIVLGQRVCIKEFFVQDFCNRDGDTGHVSIGTYSKKPLLDKLKNKFIVEAKNLYNLSHPNVVKVKDVFEDNDTAYFVMNYIDGHTLGQIVKSQGPLPEERVKRYVSQVCDALDFVHSKNMLHLDIKPDNIMIDEADNAILIDFGAAKQYDEENGHNTSTVVGQTPGFAPLEQIGNDVHNFAPATDIYSLAATTYMLLTGENPPAANMIAAGVRLNPLPDYVSARVRDTVLRSMSFKKCDRPQSIGEFRHLFFGPCGNAPHIAQPPIQAHEPSVPVKKKLDLNKSGDHGQSHATEVIGSGGGDQTPPIPPMPPVDGSKPPITPFTPPITTRPPKPQKPKPADNGNGKKKWLVPAIIGACVILGVLAGIFVIPDLLRKDTGFKPYDDDDDDNASYLEEPVEEVTTVSSSGYKNGYQWVDLGLSVKWATCNVGASSPSGYGKYFRWGEVSTPTGDSYPVDDGRLYDVSIYNISGNSSYDAATYNWGSPWRMPTEEEAIELINNCTFSFDDNNNLTATSDINGNSILLPTAGFKLGTTDPLSSTGSIGDYWTATSDDSTDAYLLRFSTTEEEVKIVEYGRDFGFCIRPVCP